MQNCKRCIQETNSVIMSKFNTDMICIVCKQKEETHPLYHIATETELNEVKKGNMNFEGIGKPVDL